MTPRKFTRFMVDVNIGGNRQLHRLTPAERWCFVAGFLAIAADAPVRGRLVVGHENATVDDYARTATVPKKVAASALAKLIDLAIVCHDDEHGCLMVDSFEEWNPPPKKDPTNAERQKRWRENRKRNALSNATVTPISNARVTQGREEKDEGEEHHLATKPSGSTPLKSLGGTNDAGATGEVWS